LLAPCSPGKRARACALHALRRYVFSCYKAFGPHLAALCGSPAALAALAPHGPNHAFVEPRSSGAARWELGTHNYEAAAGQAALGDYFRRLAAYVAS